MPNPAIPGDLSSIAVRVIPHAEQRYPTVGDYWQEADGTWQIRISRMSDPRYEMLVLIHELHELRWALDHGVTMEEIDDFDIAFEKARAAGDEDEPGDDPRCPVYEGHQQATAVERVAAALMGVDWNTYAEAVESL